MRWGAMQRQQRYDRVRESHAWKSRKENKSAGCPGAMNSGSSDDLCFFLFLLLAQESAKGGKGKYIEENGCV